jgi:ankyrin repeat protein
VSAGADLRFKTTRGHTEVYLAAQYDAVRMLRWLVVTHKLNPCEAAADGWLPLHCACFYGRTAAVEYLLLLPQAAAMVTAESTSGPTALHLAAHSEHDDIVLLRKGAAVDAKSQEGMTPLMHAQLMRTVGVLLDAHADANAVDGCGHTVLHYCARQGAAACVYKLLLQHGTVPTAVDMTGSTPAHIAGMNGHFAIEALLSKAADEYSKTQLNDTLSRAVNGMSSSEQQRRGVTHDISCNGSGSSSYSSSGSGSSSSSSSGSGTGSSSSSSSSSGQEVRRGANSETSSSEAATLADSAAVTSLYDSRAVDGSVKQKKQKVKQPCANCKKPTTRLCRRCAAVHYCSTECQKVCFKDAKHRAQCEEVASAIV